MNSCCDHDLLAGRFYSSLSGVCRAPAEVVANEQERLVWLLRSLVALGQCRTASRFLSAVEAPLVRQYLADLLTLRLGSVPEPSGDPWDSTLPELSVAVCGCAHVFANGWSVSRATEWTLASAEPIETSARPYYALLGMVRRGTHEEALEFARWLIGRCSEGSALALGIRIALHRIGPQVAWEWSERALAAWPDHADINLRAAEVLRPRKERRHAMELALRGNSEYRLDRSVAQETAGHVLRAGRLDRCCEITFSWQRESARLARFLAALCRELAKRGMPFEDPLPGWAGRSRPDG